MPFDPFAKPETLHVVISRHWKNPVIAITITHEKIEVVCQMNDFVEALLAELGDPESYVSLQTPRRFWEWRPYQKRVVAREALAARVRQSVGIVLEKIKDATSQAA